MAKTLPFLQQALVHHRAGRLAEAEEFYARARRSSPPSFEVFYLSGQLALKQRRHAEASERLARALELNPRSAPCALRLAHALKAQARYAEAQAAALRAADLDPANADAHFCVGEIVGKREGFAAAVPHFRRVTELQPEAADGWSNLGVTLAQSGAQGEALRCFERALAIDPNNAQALSGRALVLQQTHRIPEAVDAYGEVIRRHPRNFEARSARLFAWHYLDGVDRETLLAEHRLFGRLAREARGGDVTPSRFARIDRDPGRRLRVAFLSPDLRAHSVAYFLEPLLAHLPRDPFEVILCHDHPRVDAMSERLRARADGWRHFAGWPDEKVETALRNDAPDVLIDLVGHTGFNRLPLFAGRLAPVQITYLGYPDTTGLAEMDYRFTDAIADPEGAADAFHTEKLVRFAPTAWAYAPPAEAPEPHRAGDGAFTFGCFNNFSKVSDTTLRLWAAVLRACSGARLLIKSDGLDHPTMQAWVKNRCTANGIAVDRVELLGRVAGVGAHLALYQRVDVALDTFPYHGTTTTCEALWMGVPVVTLAGDRHSARVGASLLHAIGRPEWVARTPDDYVRIASELATAGRRDSENGGMLRDTVRGSALLDHAGQAARFGEALRHCWREWGGRSDVE